MSAFVCETSVEDGVEEEIFKLVRREVVGLRAINRSVMGDNIDSLLQRTSAIAVQEIDCLINELQISRERLHVESERVKREIFDYAVLNQSVLQATKLIAERLNELYVVSDAPSITDENT